MRAKNVGEIEFKRRDKGPHLLYPVDANGDRGLDGTLLKVVRLFFGVTFNPFFALTTMFIARIFQSQKSSKIFLNI